MITIETKPGVTIGFYKPPVLPYMEEFNKDSRKCIYVNNMILHVFFINKLSEITEDQAKELVEIINKDPLPTYKAYNHKGYMALSPTYYNGDTGIISLLRAKQSIETAALSVGIEEKDFDQYLVIKL